jgi:hypothetical protein
MERKWGFPWKIHIADVQYCVGCMAHCDAVDGRPRAQTYGQCVEGKPYFHQPSHSFCFPYFRIVLVELGLIEGFPQIWRSFRVFGDAYRSRWVLTHIMLIAIFPCTAHLVCVSRKNAYFTTLTVYTYCIWTMSFWEKHCAEHVNQVRLVKWHACKI